MNSITHDCPALTLRPSPSRRALFRRVSTPFASFQPPRLSSLAASSRHAPFYRLICLFIFFCRSVIRVPTFGCRSLAEQLGQFHAYWYVNTGSTWWKPSAAVEFYDGRGNPFLVSVSLRRNREPASLGDCHPSVCN